MASLKQLVGVPVLAVALMSARYARANTVVFSDNFDSYAAGALAPQSTWTGPGSVNANSSAQVTSDKRMTFATPTTGGDTFSQEFTLVPNQTYSLTFNYEGVGDGGGFIGVSQGTPGNHYWLAGTNPVYLGPSGTPDITVVSSPAVLTDGTGNVAHTVLFRYTGPSPQNFRVMSEDFAYDGLDGSNAFFDNIAVTAVPVPPAVFGGLGLMGVALGLAAFRRRQALA